MNFTKAKTYLEKINLLYQGIQEDSQISQIERKLMLDYISNLYDCFWYDEEQKEAAPRPVQAQNIVAPAPPPVKIAPSPPPTPKVVEAPVAQPIYTPPVVAPIVEAPIEAVPIAEKPKSKKFDLQLPTAIVTPATAPTGNFNAAYDELFKSKATKDLSQKLSERPIPTLKSAWGVGDKFLIVNELFDKDISAFDETIEKLNNMSNMNEARNYLETNIIKKYNWMDANKLTVVKNFIKTVGRRYI